MTAFVSKRERFIQKVSIPSNAVYTSEEVPPEGTKVFTSLKGAKYWIRPLTTKEGTARPWKTTKVGTHILNTVDKDSSILDFGAGHGTQTTRLKDEGFKNVTAYDTRSYGEDSPTTTNPDVLDEKYDVVMASNVLNVQANDEELDNTINTMINSLQENGKIIANFPSPSMKDSPKKHPEIQTRKIMAEKLTTYFHNVEQVGGVFELSNPKRDVEKSWYINSQYDEIIWPKGRQIKKRLTKFGSNRNPLTVLGWTKHDNHQSE